MKITKKSPWGLCLLEVMLTAIIKMEIYSSASIAANGRLAAAQLQLLQRLNVIAKCYSYKKKMRDWMYQAIELLNQENGKILCQQFFNPENSVFSFGGSSFSPCFGYWVKYICIDLYK